ncbi:SWIM zinc finger family protein [Thiocystis violacea]|uniref:SWIM zinc finger family protein n=1 Tax=Thiocystis violacea TaxID=13725 RepID=UPI001F5B4873|nr:SWIM zinc finger family protein [Thiocystis violacea]
MHHDALLLDTDRIETLAEPAIVREALRHCHDRCVTTLDRNEQGLLAEVEDAETGDKLNVEIALDAEGRLLAGCDCGANAAGVGLCVHAMAALFAHAQGQGEDKQLADAAEAAIKERLAKARAEVRVQPLFESAEQNGFGLWSARSLQSATHFPAEYRVHIRALDRRANHCTCPDFATNELGTCKHIEAVLHRLRKRPDYRQIKDLPPPRAYVFLDWEGDDAPVIRLRRGAETAVDLQRGRAGGQGDRGRAQAR